MESLSRVRFNPVGARAYRAIREQILTYGYTVVPGYFNAWLTQRVLATPPWADMCDIRKVYKEARRLSLITGRIYVVDHVVPLNHPRVCGLHIALNLQVIPKEHNEVKGNYWCPEQTEMFDEPEQLSLI